MRTIFFAAPLFFAMAASSALAEDRYVLEKSGDGFVRMDRQTGEMSNCTSSEGGTLVCKLAADERTAYQDEIDRLQRSLETLDQRVAKLENSLASKLESSLPTEEEFNKTLGYMERFMKSFMDLTKDFDKDEGAEKPPATPQKT